MSHRAYGEPPALRQDILVADFEDPSYGTWSVEGNAFGSAPPEGALPHQGKVTGFRGNRLANSFHGKDESTGRLLSPAFKVQRRYIKFLLGGGMHPDKACINLLVKDQKVRSATGRNREHLLWETWDVSEFAGQSAHIEIMDSHKGGWGHVLVDSIVQSDSPEKETFSLKSDDAPRWVALSQAKAAIDDFMYPKELEVNLFADGTQLANPVSICFDERNRLYVAESHRQLRGIDDNRYRVFWISDDIASQTTDDRMAMYRKWSSKIPMRYYTEYEELVRQLEDTDGDGVADKSSVFAGGFNHPLDGTAAGLLAWNGKIYFTCIPHLWQLEDRDDDGTAEVRTSLQSGFGVRVSLRGHDMHGLAVGPDGRLYFGIGDRGYNIVTKEGRRLAEPGGGAVFRCDLDGSNIEVFHTGLRNAMDLSFDKYGNLFTVDNNQGGGDDDRLVHIVYGGNSGWNMSYQNEFKSLIGLEYDPLESNPWFAEGMWKTKFDGQPAFVLPALDYAAGGPCGFVYNPGISLPGYEDHFFVCSFMGSPLRSGIETFKLMPKGASYEIEHTRQFLWNVLPTDVAFAYDGKMYISDWINTMEASDSGRIFTVHDPKQLNHPVLSQTANLFYEGFAHRSNAELADLLRHSDMRVRQRSQFALAERGRAGLPDLLKAARTGKGTERLHGVWGIGQIGRHDSPMMDYLVELLSDPDPDVRAQSAKAIGDEHHASAASKLIPLLKDASSSVRFHAAIAVGQLGHRPAAIPLIQMLRENADKDAYLRHAGVMGLYQLNDVRTLMEHSRDSSAAVRRAMVLVLRRLKDPRIAEFLHDTDPTIFAEAVRAINDLPIQDAMPELAWQIHRYIIKTEDAANILLLRILNANYRLGRPENAKWLSIFAGTANVPQQIRLEALGLLDKWENPSPVDRITGVYRPIPTRKLDEIVAAVQPGLTSIMETGDGLILAKAMSMAERFKIKFDVSTYRSLVNNQRANLDVRIEAIKQLKQRGIPDLSIILQKLVREQDERMRVEALQLLADVNPRHAVEAIDIVLRRQGLSVATDRATENWESLRIGAPSRKDYADQNAHNSVTVKWVKTFAPPHKLSGAKGELLPRMNDGLWAQNDDDVGRSVWLDGGRARMVMDLKAPIPVARISNFSWHKTNRAPQAFTLYGSDSDRLPDAESPRLSPEWKRIARIDTKPLGEGGRHASSVFAPYGSIGTYRHLLWDIPKLWGGTVVEGTFFSELDVYSFGQDMEEVQMKVAPMAVNVPEKQKAIALLATIKHRSASLLLKNWFTKMIEGEVPVELQLDLLEAAQAREEPEFAKLVGQFNDTSKPDDKLAPYRVALAGGNARQGELLFKNKPAAQCYVCHSVKGQGGKAAPDLTKVGARLSREFLLESLIFPSAAISEGFGTSLFLLKDEITVEGTITQETKDKIVLKTKDNIRMEIPKENIEASKPSAVSSMPPMDKLLSKREIRDVIEFLSTLK